MHLETCLNIFFCIMLCSKPLKTLGHVCWGLQEDLGRVLLNLSGLTIEFFRPRSSEY